MTQVICSLMLIALSISCLTNYVHAGDYKDTWKRTLITISAFSVVSIPYVASLEFIPSGFIGLLAAVTWQNISMTIHSFQTRSVPDVIGVALED